MTVAKTFSVLALAARTMLPAAALLALTGGLAGYGGLASAQEPTIGIQRSRAPDPPRRDRPRPGPTDFGDAETAPDLPAAIPSDDASSERPEEDDLDPRPRPGQRAARQDGDLNEPQPPQLRDGIVETGEPQAPQDGADPSIDSRPRAEADLFETPPSTVDTLLFQIEEIEPILDRRPARLFRFEPFDPVGIRVGSFVLFPEAEVAGNSISNVFRAPRARSDVSFDVRPSARLVSNWNRHALEFRANGIASFYNEFDSENDKAYTLETRGRIDITKRANLQGSLSRDVAQESRSAPDGRSAGTRADVTTDRAALAFNQRFNRLSLQLRGSVTDIAFGSSTASGVVTNNSTRDYATYEQGVRASWEFKPTLSAFTEVTANQRDYGALDANGIDRSSNGERYRVGVSLGNTGELLRGEASVGYSVQRPSSRSLPDVTGVIVDANLTWRPTALTSFLFSARSDVAESTTTGVGGVRTQSAGIEARHAFQRQLIGTAGLTYTNSTYVGSSLVEDELRASLGLEYFLNRETVLFSRYTHTAFMSNAANASYDIDEVRVGVRFRR